ncbi:hypothetical protein [Idiomarina sp.]|uniref:hypothetical protein n=1 Tax=Idiomarina sp. TaxID=1874361 RepID=UPI003A92782D
MQIPVRPLTEEKIIELAKLHGLKSKLSKDLINTIVTQSSLASNEGMDLHQHAFVLNATLANRLPKGLDSVDFCAAISREFLNSNLDKLYRPS